MMNTPDETAEAVLKGDLGHKDMTFRQFRQAMIEEHPDYLDDTQIHDLFQKHVVTPFFAGPDAVRAVDNMFGTGRAPGEAGKLGDRFSAKPPLQEAHMTSGDDSLPKEQAQAIWDRINVKPKSEKRWSDLTLGEIGGRVRDIFRSRRA